MPDSKSTFSGPPLLSTEDVDEQEQGLGSHPADDGINDDNYIEQTEEYDDDDTSRSSNSCSRYFNRLPSWAKAGVIVLSIGAIVGAFLGLLLGNGSGSGNPLPRYQQRPVVISTWFANAVSEAWLWANHSYPALDIVENGCITCENAQCDGTVGWGGSPDTNGETTLDALIMDGVTHDVGAVGYLRRIKNAISTARKVLHYTTHTLLAGDGATNFSVMMGFTEQDIHSQNSIYIYNNWTKVNCQPNYYLNMYNVNTTCGPYVPIPTPAPAPVTKQTTESLKNNNNNHQNNNNNNNNNKRLIPSHPNTETSWVHSTPEPTPVPFLSSSTTFNWLHRWWYGNQRIQKQFNPEVTVANTATSSRRRPTPASRYDHDTIGMCGIDMIGNVAVGMSSNGADHKVAGRIGDAPIVGAGGYASNEAGCSAATGDGDITMRFLPAYTAVESMRRGMSPVDACTDAVKRIEKYYPTFELGLICVNMDGEWGAASHGWTFTYCVAAPSTKGQTRCIGVPPMDG